MIKHKSLVVRFINEIRADELSKFRGVILNATKDNPDILFHNHQEDGGFRYAYPLIQYKRINGKATIVCLGQGTDVISKFFAACNFDAKIGKREEMLEIESIRANQHFLQIYDTMLSYSITRWIPLSGDNYREYLKLDSLVDRITFLEKIMVGNILSFYKGMGVHAVSKIELKILNLKDPVSIMYKGIKMMGFNADFKTNAFIPDYIGLGKGVSLGNGIVRNSKN